eukprot:212426-Chlamydomonas_euryale.AAC.3
MSGRPGRSRPAAGHAGARTFRATSRLHRLKEAFALRLCICIMRTALDASASLHTDAQALAFQERSRTHAWLHMAMTAFEQTPSHAASHAASHAPPHAASTLRHHSIFMSGLFDETSRWVKSGQPRSTCVHDDYLVQFTTTLCLQRPWLVNEHESP